MRFAAVVPAAPALLPALTGGPVVELEPVRRATAAALERLASALLDDAHPLVVLAPGGLTRRLRADAVTGLDGFGVAVAGGSPGPRSGPDGTLATGPALALFLLADAGIATPAEHLVVQEVSTGEPTADCLRLGAALAAESGPHASWLVLGDGSARRTPKAPGAFDPDAEAFDEAAAKALDAADPAALVELDAQRATRVMAAGRAVWQVLAGAAGREPGSRARAGVIYHGAPLGVGYIVAAWDFPQQPRTAGGTRAGDA